MKQRLQLTQRQKLSPKQIQFLGLLQIPITSLEQRVEDELEKNPVLEETIVEEDSEELISEYYSQKKYRTEPKPMPLEERAPTLYDSLLKQITLLNLTHNELELAEYLIGCLDEKGFLTRDLYSIESDLLLQENIITNEQELENILYYIQSLEPKGVGARDLKECLLIQLRAKTQTEEVKDAIFVLEQFYIPFSKKNFESILKDSYLQEDALRKVYQVVEKLNPNPGSLFFMSNEPTTYILPDFTVVNTDGKLQLFLHKSSNRQLFISKEYEKMLAETKDEATIDFLKQKIESAKWFVEAINQREETLKKVMQTILEYQQSYFISGRENDLKPMKLMDIAEIVKMDISTISRVSNSKYVETEFGTFLLKDLFSEAYHKEDGTAISVNEIKAKLVQIIAIEDKKNPFSDEQLAEMLGAEEYLIARRTVAKYREQLNISVSRLRRTL